jgi:hypothetical protein
MKFGKYKILRLKNYNNDLLSRGKKKGLHFCNPLLVFLNFLVLPQIMLKNK